MNATVEFVEAFDVYRSCRAYLDDDGYRGLQTFLAGEPDAGDVMPGTGGFRKLRWGVGAAAKASAAAFG